MKPLNKENFYPAMFVTYLNLLAGITGIYFVYKGQINEALVALIVAALFDVSDGMVARLSKQTEKQQDIGIIADSLADMVSFGILPVFIVLSRVEISWFVIVVITLYAVFAMHRLILFSVDALKKRKPTKVFYGLPVIFNAALLPFGFVLFHRTPWYSSFLVICTLVIGYLFVSDIPIQKPRGRFAYATYILIAISLIIGLMLCGN